MDHRVPRFQIIEQIGQGQFSNVYKARMIYPKAATPLATTINNNNNHNISNHHHQENDLKNATNGLNGLNNNRHQMASSCQHQNNQHLSHQSINFKTDSNQPQLIDFGCSDGSQTNVLNLTNQEQNQHHLMELSDASCRINNNKKPIMSNDYNISDILKTDTTNTPTSSSLSLANKTSMAINHSQPEINGTKRNIEEKFVALKKVRFYEIQNSKMRNDCLKEVKLLQQLNHPNIINYSISFIEQNYLYIVLEFADGGDLSKLINYFQRKNMLLSETCILKYFTQVCSAIRYIHSKRILHRDIKPANIFMTSTGCVKLGDFGLGRFFGQNTRNAHSYVGTFYYMSPERIREWGYDFSSDVWSLGCVLYELITLYSPFSILFNQNNAAKHNHQNQNQIYPDKRSANNTTSNDQQKQQQHHFNNVQKVNPFNLQWIIDCILRADYPSLAGYANISHELRHLATKCLSLQPSDRPNMDVICGAVQEAQSRLATRNSATRSMRLSTMN